MINTKEENKAEKGYRTSVGVLCVYVCVGILDRMARADRTEKGSFGWRPEGNEERTKEFLWEKWTSQA